MRDQTDSRTLPPPLGPWAPVSLLRGPEGGKARLVVRRSVLRDGVPVSECLPGTFSTYQAALTAAVVANA